MEWNHYIKRGEGWTLTIERDETPPRLWTLWYCTQEDGTRHLGFAASAKQCAALIRPEAFKKIRKSPPAEIFLEEFPQGWCRVHTLEPRKKK